MKINIIVRCLPMGLKEASLQEHQQALCLLLKEFDRVCRQLNIPYMLFAGSMLGAVRHKGFIPWDDDLDVLMLRPDYERFLKEAETVLDRETFFLQKEFSENWPMFFSKLRLNGTTCLEKYHPKNQNTHQGVYMDLFPCDAALDSELGRKLQFFASKVVIAKSLDRRGYDTDSKTKRLFMTLCRFLPTKPFLSFAKMGKRDSRVVHTFFGGARGYEKNIYPRDYFTSYQQAAFEGEDYPISEKYDALLSLLYGDYMTLPPEEDRLLKQHAIFVNLEHSYEIFADFRNDMTFETYTRSIR